MPPGSDPLPGFVATIFAIFLAYLRGRGKGRRLAPGFCGRRWRYNSVWPLSLLYAIACAIVLAQKPRIGRFQCSPSWLIIAGCIVTAIRRLQRISATAYDIAKMDPIARERLFGLSATRFDSPVTLLDHNCKSSPHS